jgi:predicted nuclease of predicted toxin-antitoxin system
VKFLVDNQLPKALARFLTSRGSDCQHVLDIRLDGATDATI